MTSYIKTMREAREEMLRSLNENNLDESVIPQVKEIVAKKSAKKIGGVMVDTFTASAISQIYDKVNDANKELMDSLSITKLADLAFKLMQKSEFVPEEVELDEAQDVTLPKGVGFYDTTKYPIGGKFDRVTDPKGLKVTVKRRFKSFKGTDAEGITDDGRKVAFRMGLATEETKLDEASYALYHKDFSSAMQHAYKMAKKMYGITIDPKEIDDKVASGPRKPSEGKTNKYRLKGDKGAIQVQVYNKGGSKPFELNMYKEEVELDEKPADFIRLSFNSPADVKKAKKWMDENLPGADQGFTGIDASGKDIEFEDVDDAEDLMSKLKKAGFRFKVDYREEAELDEKLDKEDEPIIKKVVKMLKKASGAHAGQAKDLEKAMTEEDEIDEGKMSQLHQLIKDGKSAKEIAKIMKLDIKTIQALMDEKSELEENLDGRTREYRQHRERLESMRLKRQEARHVDPADIDTSATDDDIKAADKNIMMQLRKSVSLRGQFSVEFLDKKKVKIPQKIAQAVITKYNSLRKPIDKEKFQAKIAKSHRDLLMALKEGFASDAQRRAAFAQGYEAKGKKKKESTLERMNKKLQERQDG